MHILETSVQRYVENDVRSENKTGSALSRAKKCTYDNSETPIFPQNTPNVPPQKIKIILRQVWNARSKLTRVQKTCKNMKKKVKCATYMKTSHFVNLHPLYLCDEYVKKKKKQPHLTNLVLNVFFTLHETECDTVNTKQQMMRYHTISSIEYTGAHYIHVKLLALLHNMPFSCRYQSFYVNDLLVYVCF